MSNNSHPNSRKVTIFRSNSFLLSAQNPDGNEQVADFIAMSQKNIGPFWASHTAKIIGSGLTLLEQKLLMPEVLSMSKDDRDFPKKVFDFFNALVTKIPPTAGKEFEIGLTEDNSKPISESNLPLKLEDYIRYRHAKEHPWVAKDQIEAKGNQLKYFYIFDTELKAQEESDKLVIADEADEIWLKIKANISKVTMLLTLMGEDERDFISKNADVKKQTTLRSKINENPGKFLRVYKDEKFETKFWLRAMRNAGVIEVVGTNHVIRESSKSIGHSELEALLYLENEANADTVSYLKSTTQDVLRKPRVMKGPRKPVTNK